jgi:hypothetical protein
MKVYFERSLLIRGEGNHGPVTHVLCGGTSWETHHSDKGTVIEVEARRDDNPQILEKIRILSGAYHGHWTMFSLPHHGTPQEIAEQVFSITTGSYPNIPLAINALVSILDARYKRDE